MRGAERKRGRKREDGENETQVQGSGECHSDGNQTEGANREKVEAA